MKDCKGNEIAIGDEVVYIKGKTSSAQLDTGKITKIYHNTFYDRDECSVGHQAHIFSSRVMKL